MEIRNETQNNSENEYEYKYSRDKVGDSESIAEDINNQSETEKCYNISKKRAPNYSHVKTVGYINTHVKIISRLNVMSAIAKFHKPDIETTLVTHYLLSQYITNKLIKLFNEHGVRSVRRELEQLHDRKLIQPRLPRDITAE